jgi:single-strand DNA-binding protein
MPKANKAGENAMVANFSLATNETYNDKEGKAVEKTEWHRIVAWNKTAEIIKNHVKKGDHLYLEGKIKTNSWEDKEGVKRQSTEIHCDNFMFLSSKNSKREA